MPVQPNRRQFLKTLAASTLSSLVLGACTNTGPKKTPNIVLIMADDLGYECIGADGGTTYATPRIDKLAASGIRFEHCYAQPLCTPTRVKLMTGMYNIRNYTQFGQLDRGQTTFAHLFKQQGYATCIAGKWQLGTETDSPQHFGFDESCLWQQSGERTDENGHDTRYPNPVLDINGVRTKFSNGEYGPDVASDFICDFITRHREAPFLAYYPMILTHCPFVPTPDSTDWNPADPGTLDYKGDPKYFKDMVAYTDKLVGKIVDHLEKLGLRDNTLVILTGDNGTDTPVVSDLNGRQVAGGKGKTTDAGTRVPLVANWPGVVPAGQVCPDLVDFSDFLPTLCEIANIPVPDDPNLDGHSFEPQLKGEKGNPREWLYCWFSRNGKAEDARVFARTRRYKLYQNGGLYDIEKDVLEQSPLTDDQLNEQAKTAKVMLQSVLDRYAGTRYSAVQPK